MLMKRKKIIFLFTSILGFLTFFIYLVDKKQSINPGLIEHFKIQPNLIETCDLQSLSVESLLTLNDFKPWLETIEKKIWAEIYESYNLNEEKCSQLRNELQSEYKQSIEKMNASYSKDQKPLEKNTITCIYTIIKENNINPDHISLIPWNVEIPASSTDFTLLINEALFKELNHETKKFIIGHELTHIINKDHSTRWIIRNSTPIKPLKDDCNNPLNKLCHFHELRADIVSSIKGKDYAAGALKFMNDQTIKFGELHCTTYPTYAMRELISSKIAHIHDSSLNQARHYSPGKVQLTQK